jgi:hypothetical protein
MMIAQVRHTAMQLPYAMSDVFEDLPKDIAKDMPRIVMPRVQELCSSI